MRPGDVIENAATGERLVFRRCAADTGGELLEFDSFWTRPGQRAAEHVHPGMQERFEVIEGRARFRVAGEQADVGRRGVLVVDPGTPHAGWNPGPGPAHLRVQFRPALRWEEVAARLFELAREGRTDARGTPPPEVLAQLLRQFPRELAAPRPRTQPAGYS